MTKRVSKSLLDPLMIPQVPRLYRVLPIPRWFPPEGIVLTGHLVAIGGAVGFAFSTTTWWGGLLAAFGVAGNHLCDMVDGTHARQTNQCRNGGELLDHFTDPLSFAYWIVGMGVSCYDLTVGLSLALAGVIVLFATAVLTSIKAKLIGSFELARFGPTEFKVLLTLYGLGLMAYVTLAGASTMLPSAGIMATWFVSFMLAVGVIQLIVNLIRSIRQVNRSDSKPDTSEWELRK